MPRQAAPGLRAVLGPGKDGPEGRPAAPQSCPGPSRLPGSLPAPFGHHRARWAARASLHASWRHGTPCGERQRDQGGLAPATWAADAPRRLPATRSTKLSQADQPPCALAAFASKTASPCIPRPPAMHASVLLCCLTIVRCLSRGAAPCVILCEQALRRPKAGEPGRLHTKQEKVIAFRTAL